MLFLNCKKLHAQDSLYVHHMTFLSAAIGGGGSSFGLSSYANVSYHYRTNSLNIGYINSNEYDLFNRTTDFFYTTFLPSISIREINICINHSIAESKKFKTEIGGGVNFAQGTIRGTYLYESSIVLGPKKYYQPVNFSVIGMDINIRETLKLKNNFSLELNVFTNLNPEKSYYGALFGVVYSYPFTEK
jgi:hypothetical protein